MLSAFIDHKMSFLKVIPFEIWNMDSLCTCKTSNNRSLEFMMCTPWIYTCLGMSGGLLDRDLEKDIITRRNQVFLIIEIIYIANIYCTLTTQQKPSFVLDTESQDLKEDIQ